MLTANLMAKMSDAHLIAAAQAEKDPMTSTALECELLARLENRAEAVPDDLVALIDEYEIEAEWLRDLIEAHPANIKSVTAMLKVLSTADIETPEKLAEKLERADKFYDIAQEAGDVFLRLNDLAQSTN